MRWLVSIVQELFGLFVDDGRFALGILIWLAVAALCLPHLPLQPLWPGLLLFLGLATVLVWSCLHRVLRGPR
jgi:membrane protein implicated in regulation of membrane protease activity